jgi:hypothetical protein
MISRHMTELYVTAQLYHVLRKLDVPVSSDTYSEVLWTYRGDHSCLFQGEPCSVLFFLVILTVTFMPQA